MVENNNSSPGIPDHNDSRLFDTASQDLDNNGNKHHQDSLQEESNITAAATAKLNQDSVMQASS